MTLKIYVNFLSQPARALAIFLRQNKIPHTTKIVDLMSGEHMTKEYIQNVHQFGKVPAIDDDGFKMIESIAILRYLARKYNVPDHWYPKDLQKQARVDEFLEWQHIGARAPLAMYFRTLFLVPMVTGKPADEAKVLSWKKKMETALDEIENVWLKRSQYLGGDQISIADIIGLCEIDQPSESLVYTLNIFWKLILSLCRNGKI
ncbi:UNVERIFIED_CONTAM: hypothetical protein PYX00_005248 [Menopon gallinae]|uniref:Glutathione S-transferase theta n=1 Tax=Menopon gallinae TaxID=328185 RepID=A0AAW2HQL9_9NEOP